MEAETWFRASYTLNKIFKVAVVKATDSFVTVRSKGSDVTIRPKKISVNDFYTPVYQEARQKLIDHQREKYLTLKARAEMQYEALQEAIYLPEEWSD
jgi:lipoate-protein ligase A